MSDERDRVRLFVALELPGPVREALVSWREPIVAERSELRSLAPDSLHVTLCFLGSRWADEIPQIAAACVLAAGGSLVEHAGRRAAGEAPLELSLGEPLWLPPRRPGVLAVSLDSPDGAVARLQAALARALVEGGWYEPESRPFLAHVTVARVRKGARIRREELPAPAATPFRATTVTLYRSRLGVGLARYEPLQSVSLG